MKVQTIHDEEWDIGLRNQNNVYAVLDVVHVKEGSSGTALTWKQVKSLQSVLNNEGPCQPITFAGRGTHEDQIVFWFHTGFSNGEYIPLTLESQEKLAQYVNEFVLDKVLKT